MSVRIANAQGFWGDRACAASDLLKQQPDLDYITLDYLAEVSLSIMAIQREKDSSRGYAKDFLSVVQSLIPFWEKGYQAKVITNAGGLNPRECAQQCRQLLNEANLSFLKIGIVSGDDVLPLFEKDQFVTANAYLGAEPIVALLKQGCHLIITGRVADPSLTVAPCIAHHHWALDDYDRIAQATVAGHLIECGTQVTGGIATDWLEHFTSINELANLSFPYVQVFENGDFIVTKPEKSPGRVDERTVKEQLLYELGNPDEYLSPDVTASILQLQLKEQRKNRIFITGAKGKSPPPMYKVSATFRDGYKTEAFLAIFGPHARKKAHLCGEIILKRVENAGFHLERSLIECLGTGDIVRGLVPPQEKAFECVLRIAVADSRKEALECFVQEVAPLVTSGPQGTTGYTSGRPSIRQVFGYKPCLIERDRVNIKKEIL